MNCYCRDFDLGNRYKLLMDKHRFQSEEISDDVESALIYDSILFHDCKRRQYEVLHGHDEYSASTRLE